MNKKERKKERKRGFIIWKWGETMKIQTFVKKKKSRFKQIYKCIYSFFGDLVNNGIHLVC
jgi:hypothetical protein